MPPTVAPASVVYQPPENTGDLLVVDEAMRQFFASRVDRNGLAHERLRDIITAILRPEGLAYAYDAEGAYDARETFRRRGGNCQAFAFLVAAMAREYGLRVKFQDIGTLQRWNRFDRYVATVRHTNVRMIDYGEDYIVDLRPDLGRPSLTSDFFVVKDERAFAHFYTTAGFFRLVHGDCEGALRLMRRATEVDPASAVVWSNLGNLYVQLGELAMARACFERALQIERGMEDALTGLVRVLRLQGGPEELKRAAKYERRAESYRKRNPYFVFHLAAEARQRGDVSGAERELRRAIHMKDDEPLFHEELISLLREAGREEEVRRAEAKFAKVRQGLAKVQPYVMP